MILVMIIINHTIHTLYERKFQEFCESRRVITITSTTKMEWFYYLEANVVSCALLTMLTTLEL